jgi:16S rRNA (adenine1518-N6/adenine1519-N6)-dimethyltransferase
VASHRPRKRFSQNFLVDRHVIGRIVQAIDPQPGDRMVEIGPGLGALTEPLLERLGHLDAIEIDRDAARALEQRFRPERLTVHVEDALHFDLSRLGERLRMVGNLPYHISTPLLFRMDEEHERIVDGHFMLQKEVVQRMVACPGNAEYGRLSVMLQYRWTMEALFDVAPEAFQPRPRVWSSVIRLLPRSEPRHQARDEAMFGRVVLAAFTQRRKTLRNVLRGLLDQAAIEACGIDPQARGETLDVGDFVRLADAAVSVSSG